MVGGSRDTRLVVLVMLVILGLAVTGASAQSETPDYRPSTREAALTPKFCWKQFMGDKFSGPQFEIPRKTCGVYMNHYCYGMIDLNRANSAVADEGRRRAYLLRAKKNTLYTLRGMKGFPNCPIRAHAETTLRIIEIKLGALR